jgi:hypothetical protein
MIGSTSSSVQLGAADSRLLPFDRHVGMAETFDHEEAL